MCIRDRLSVKKALDFEGQPGAVDQVLKVSVADGEGKKSTEVDVTIKLQDVNEAPTINAQTITIAEDAEPTVARSAPVVATDPDQGQFLRYSIKGPNPSGGKISIDSASGEYVVGPTRSPVTGGKSPTVTLRPAAVERMSE